MFEIQAWFINSLQWVIICHYSLLSFKHFCWNMWMSILSSLLVRVKSSLLTIQSREVFFGPTVSSRHCLPIASYIMLMHLLSWRKRRIRCPNNLVYRHDSFDAVVFSVSTAEWPCTHHHNSCQSGFLKLVRCTSNSNCAVDIIIFNIIKSPP